MNTTKVSIPYLVEQVGFKVVSINDMLHIIMELKYMLLLLLNPEIYYTLFKLQMCLQMGVTPPMIGKMIVKGEFFAM
jgi:hypothetical protein